MGFRLRVLGVQAGLEFAATFSRSTLGFRVWGLASELRGFGPPQPEILQSTLRSQRKAGRTA